MQRSSTKRRIGSHAPLAAIVLSQGSQNSEHSRAGLVLILFMRFVAVVWIVKGLMQWNTVFGLSFLERDPNLALPIAEIGTVVFFAIIDLVASVGLWLATSWGGVIWLVSVGARVLVAIIMPGVYASPARWLIVIANLLLVGLYMVLTWRVAVAEQRPPP